MSAPKLPISVTIIALNEEKRIGSAIESVREWVAEVIVADSGSTDRTREIAFDLGARVIEKTWQGFGSHKNFAQGHAKSEWVLNIDADERVSTELAKEIREVLSAPGTEDVVAFRIPRKTWFLGRWVMHGGWYPNYLVRLSRRTLCRWSEPEVHESLEPIAQSDSSRVSKLMHPLLHYTFEDLRDQIQTNVRYSYQAHLGLKRRGVPSSVVQLLIRPWVKFLECYFFKLGFLDGLAGFIIAVNAAHSAFLKYAYGVEDRLEGRAS